ncbi:hypothetical protein ACLB2K_048198 [Fragaria x ananassa]
MDSNYTAKLVYSGEEAAISFDHSVSYFDFANSVRVQFLVLGRSIVKLRYTVFPDVVSYCLENEDDMKMMFRVLARYSSDFVDVDVCSFDVSASGSESVLSNNVSKESSISFDENDYLGCYKPEEAKSCHGVVRLQTNKMMSSKIIKSIMLDKVHENPNKKAIDIYHEIKSDYGMEVSYHTAWYDKERARESVLGGDVDSYICSVSLVWSKSSGIKLWLYYQD